MPKRLLGNSCTGGSSRAHSACSSRNSGRSARRTPACEKTSLSSRTPMPMPLSTQSRYGRPSSSTPCSKRIRAVPARRRARRCAGQVLGARLAVAAGVQRVLVQLADGQGRVAVQLLAHEQLLHPVLGEPEPDPGRLVGRDAVDDRPAAASSVVDVGRQVRAARASDVVRGTAARCASASSWFSVSMWTRSATSIAGWAQTGAEHERGAARVPPGRVARCRCSLAGVTGSTMPRCSPIDLGQRGRLHRQRPRGDQQVADQPLPYAVAGLRGQRARPVVPGQEAGSARIARSSSATRLSAVEGRRRRHRLEQRSIEAGSVGGRPPADPPVQQPPADLRGRFPLAGRATAATRAAVAAARSSGRTARTRPGRWWRPATGSGRPGCTPRSAAASARPQRVVAGTARRPAAPPRPR